jgi:hypothetical protein
MARVELLLERLVTGVVADVLAAVRAVPIGDLLQVTQGKPSRQNAPLPQVPATKRGPGRPRKVENQAKPASKKKQGRRSGDELEKLVEQVVAFVAEAAPKNPEGVSLRQIAAGVRHPAGELTRPLQKALKSRGLTKEGERGQTRYFPGKG